MGDNVYLGDRDGVRTPMQWTGDRNGGFSRADFAQLYAPPLMDPVYGYQAVNVEAQLRTPTSLLRWLRRFIALRKEHPVFGLGTYEPLEPSQPADLRPRPPLRGRRRAVRAQPRALARRRSSSTCQPTRAARPMEMFGRTRFPRIGELPYLLTLAPARLLLVPAQGGPRRRHGADRWQALTWPRSTRRRSPSGCSSRAGSAPRRATSRSSTSSTSSRCATSPPRSSLALVEARFPAGTHEVYQLLLGRRRPTAATTRVIDEVGGVDGLRRARRPARAASCSRPAARRRRGPRRARARRVPLARGRRAAAAGRRRAPDRRRAVQLLDRLRRRADPEGVPPRRAGRQPRARDAALPLRARLPAHRRRSRGWYEYEGELMDATLGVAAGVPAPARRDGWELALDELGDDPERFVDAPARRSARSSGGMHTVARPRTPPTRPSRPRSPSDEALALLTATIDEEIERVFLELPDDRGGRRRSPAAAQEVRDRLQLLSHVGARRQADPHPRRPAPRPDDARRPTAGSSSTSRASRRGRCPSAAASARRCATSRACCARSPTRPSAARAAARHAGARGLGGARARGASWTGYFGAVDAVAAAARRGGRPRSCSSIFELEKAVYELRYELNNRPDWVRIPVAGIVRLLEEPL